MLRSSNRAVGLTCGAALLTALMGVDCGILSPAADVPGPQSSGGGGAGGQPTGCTADADCGTSNAGKICDDDKKVCVNGCRIGGQNGCPEKTTCTPVNNSTTIGACVPLTCTVPSDCGMETVCVTWSCANNACVQIIKPSVASQVYGDCKTTTCDEQGMAKVVDDKTDPYDDGNACTADICSSGMPTNPPVMPAGTICPGGFCDGNGACVQCIEDGDCASVSKRPRCSIGVCVADHCLNATKDGSGPGTETGVDCGGDECKPCASDGTKNCSDGQDCISGVCTTGACQAPSCTDGIANGDETDKDCGGPTCTTKCGDMPPQTCKLATDCSSKVCKAGLCQAPTCTDSIQNGEETAVDCGGSCMPPCP